VKRWVWDRKNKGGAHANLLPNTEIRDLQRVWSDGFMDGLAQWVIAKLTGLHCTSSKYKNTESQYG
jgi:hypothetical protein